MIEIDNLCFRYTASGPNIFNNLALKVEQGEVLAVLGKNGAGKTTLLKCITGEIRNYIGNIIINGKDVNDIKTAEMSKLVAMVASNSPCYQNLCVADYLVTGFANNLSKFASPSREQYDKAYAKLELLGKKNLFVKHINQLSSGEMQIVKITRAILQNPRIIIFDEPTSNLDVANQLLVIEQISHLSEMGYSVITTTHNPGQIYELNGLVLMLYDNSYKFGSAEEIMTEENLSNVYGLNSHIDKNCFRKFAVFSNSNYEHSLFY